jgi:hypothetical protein
VLGVLGARFQEEKNCNRIPEPAKSVVGKLERKFLKVKNYLK